MTGRSGARMFTGRRIGIALLLLVAAFAIWSFVTLPLPDPRYGDPARPISGTGAVMPRLTGNGDDWTGTGGDPGGSQWSPLAAINRGNVAGLKVAWTHRSGDFLEAGQAGEGTMGTNLEQTPVVIGSTLYYCTPFDRVFALDAATGRQRWVFDPRKPIAGSPAIFSDAMKQKHCRGVAYWRDATATPGSLCAERIYRALGDRAIVALDTRTGRPCPGFGAPNRHAGFVSHKDFDPRGEGPVSASSPPIVIGDVLVAATGARDSLVDAADGIVRGFDARDGRMLWEFDPIPAEHAHETGAANVWTLLSGDPMRKLVFLATTEPSPDYYGGGRKFDIPYANAVVAVSTETGKVVWHYQIVHHDVFDYDLPTHPTLVTIRKDGQRRDVVIQATKMGTLFVLDRDTGKPVFPIDEVPVPASRVPGEKLSPTQPMPRLPEPFGVIALKREEVFGLTPLDRAWCRRRFDGLRYDGIFTPPDPHESLNVPSSMGGANWGGVAYDPATNLLIVKSANVATTMSMRPAPVSDSPSQSFMSRVIPGTGLKAEGEYFMSPLGVPCNPPPWGTLTAIDMESGRTVWKVPLGQSYRFGITVPASFGWGSPNVGGPIVTAGGLVFVGASLDAKFRALDVRTGRELWQAKLPAPGMAVPATYRVAGRQYVTIAAGGNAIAGTAIGDSLVTFALEK